jgi:hypothetical protein
MVEVMRVLVVVPALLAVLVLVTGHIPN